MFVRIRFAQTTKQIHESSESKQDVNDTLTKMEIPEWGDITDKKVRKYIKSYSSLQNVEKSQSSNTIVWSILGQTDNYVDNNDVI